VRGTTSNDTFVYSGGPSPVIAINGDAYTGSLTGITTVRFVGGGGNDVLSLAGGPHAETFTLSIATAMVTGGERTVEAAGMRNIVAAAGTGDRLVLTGTDENDAFSASPAVATLASGGFHVTAVNFTSVRMDAGAGVDRVTLSGSAGDDTLTATTTQ